MRRMYAFLAAVLVALPAAASAYPNGTPYYVTDAAPFCASCHSSARDGYMPEFPPDVAAKELPENKHYALVNMPAMPSPYLELTQEQKERIIKDARRIDTASSVTISAPSRVKAGAEIKVTVKARGGNGPVICVMLVDRALRFQARPVSSDGWLMTAEPVVKGQDGAAQKGWLDRRARGLGKNINFVMVDGQKFDLEKNLFPSAEVTYALRAPRDRGSYTLTAAFLYGTENAQGAGFFQRPSGRILFSDELKVEVE